MQPIPLISTDHVDRIVRLLEANGIPSRQYLERARLPRSEHEGGTAFVPGRSVYALAGAVDDGEALGDFWLEIARLSNWPEKCAWAQPLKHAVNLCEAIRATCSSYARQIPINRLGLQLGDESAWFWRKRTCDVHDWPGREPAEQYTLSFMLAVIRAAAPGWQPERLQVEGAASGWVATTRSLSDVSVDCDRAMLAIEIPKPMLALPVSIRGIHGDEGVAPATDFRGSLHQVLEPWFEHGLPSQDEAAELLWTSPRTLRRRLAEEGSSWQATLDDIKFSRAVRRLREGRFSRLEIAQELGYSDTSHFIRFFRRCSGLAPGDYLAEIERADEIADRRRP